MFNKKVLFVLAMIVAIQSPYAPETNYGDKSIACNPNSSPRVTGGFATNFNDDRYKCSEWSGKAMGRSDCFVALNGICGMDASKFCNKCVNIINGNGQGIKCRIIDFCDPSNCHFYDAGHLDVLYNNGGSNYRFLDVGKYVLPIPKEGKQPAVNWSYVSC